MNSSQIIKEQMLVEIDQFEKRLEQLLTQLPPESESEVIREAVLERYSEVIGKWVRAVFQGLDLDEMNNLYLSIFATIGCQVTEEGWNALQSGSQRIEARVRDHYTVKPRFADRDSQIVRLRDEENKSFGEIAILLRTLNSDWVGKEGKPMTADAVRKAYLRAKEQAEHSP